MAYYDPYSPWGNAQSDQSVLDQTKLVWEGKEAAMDTLSQAAASSINTPSNYTEIHSKIPEEFQKTTSTQYGDTPSHAATYNPYSKRYYDAASGNLYALNDDLTVNYNKIVSGPGKAQTSTTPISTQGWTAQDWQSNAGNTDDREGKVQIDDSTGDVYVWVDGGLHYLGNKNTKIESQNTFMTNYYQKKAEVEEVVKQIEQPVSGVGGSESNQVNLSNVNNWIAGLQNPNIWNQQFGLGNQNSLSSSLNRLTNQLPFDKWFT